MKQKIAARMFDWLNFRSTKNAQYFVQKWHEVFEEQGERAATIGIIQMVFYRLQQSCEEDVDMRFSENLNLDTFDMENFILAHTRTNVFDIQQLKADDVNLAELIVRLMRSSHEHIQWLRYFGIFLRTMLRNEKGVFLVVKTTIRMYTDAAFLQNDPNFGRTDFQAQMQHTCQYLSTAIEEAENLASSSMKIIIDTLFNHINRHPRLIQNDANGFVRIITKCLSYENIDINIDILNRIIHCAENKNVGNAMLRLCASESIVRELTTIITEIAGIKVQELALELAGQIQRVVQDRDVFEMKVFQMCIVSDNKRLQQLATALCLAVFRRLNGNADNSAEVLIRAISFHQRFRKNYTTGPKYLINMFFDEFTNWNAVFETLQMRLDNVEFVTELFCLLKRVIDRIKKEQADGHDRVENQLRSFLEKSINFMENLDRQYVEVFANLIFIIEYTDEYLKFISYRNNVILANIVSNKFINYFNEYVHQMNVASVFNILLQRNYIQDHFLLNVFRQLIRDRKVLDLKKTIDFDANPNLLHTFMNISVLAQKKMIPRRLAAWLCNESNEWVQKNQGKWNLQQKQYRTFLAYNFLILVECHITAYAQDKSTVENINVAQVTDILVDLLSKTQNNLDFLCTAIFWCITNLELYFNSVTRKFQNIKALSQYVLLKISLVIKDKLGVDQNQLQYMKYMLASIKELIKNKRELDLHQIVVALHKRFFDYDFVHDMLVFCAQSEEPIMLAHCAIGVLKELSTKKDKTVFMKSLEAIVKTAPNPRLNWLCIVRMGHNEFGKGAQEQHDTVWAKKAKQTGRVINDISFRNI